MTRPPGEGHDGVLGVGGDGPAGRLGRPVGRPQVAVQQHRAVLGAGGGGGRAHARPAGQVSHLKLSGQQRLVLTSVFPVSNCVNTPS